METISTMTKMSQLGSLLLQMHELLSDLVSLEVVQVQTYKQEKHSLSVQEPMERKSWFSLKIQQMLQSI